MIKHQHICANAKKLTVRVNYDEVQIKLFKGHIKHDYLQNHVDIHNRVILHAKMAVCGLGRQRARARNDPGRIQDNIMLGSSDTA